MFIVFFCLVLGLQDGCRFRHFSDNLYVFICCGAVFYPFKLTILKRRGELMGRCVVEDRQQRWPDMSSAAEVGPWHSFTF